jgi:muramoyltetrapeptide carboxypeptidase
MFHDPDVQAIFCSRAGYGSGRLLPLLDWQTLGQQPKIFLGYSDVTLLLNAFVQRAGFVCFHGPLVSGEFAEDFSPRSQTHLLRLLTEGKGEEAIAFPTVVQSQKTAGIVEGRLLGGCLSMLAATLGTPFVIDTTDCILFIEDVGERPYRVDRMLTQLKQAGKLDRLAGVIFGEMSGCWEAEQDLAPVRAVIQDIFADSTYPVGFGLPAGHAGENFALPLGTRVRLDMEQQELRFLETAVV